MALLESDLKLVHAVEDSQFDTGGGPLTTREILDGNIGELIDPIDEVAASIGRVYLYKGGAVADTDTKDRLQNAFLFISEIPSDALLTATLTTTKDPFDRLPAIRSYIESYYDAATPWFGYFLGTQSSGLRSIVLFQRTGTALPQVGSTLCIIMDEGQSTQKTEYVVVDSVKSETRTFSDGQGEFTRLIVTVNLQDRLSNTFPGNGLAKQDPPAPRSVLKTTYIAAKAKYYGMTHTTAALDSGNNVLYVAKTENQLVPTASTSTSHVDLRAAGDDSTLVAAASGQTTVTAAGQAFGPGVVLHAGLAIYPGTVQGTFGGVAFTDANGILYAGSLAIGTLDYANGTLTASGASPNYNAPSVFSFYPAGVVQAPFQTAKIEVTANNQWTDYTITLPLQPEPGTLRIYYKAQGLDYLLQDRGDGVCVGYDDAYGIAQVRFDTRSVTLALATLPDVDTFLLFAWGVKSYVFNRGNASLGKAYFEIVTAAALPPSGLSIAWTDETGSRTATDDGVGNLVSTHATGKVFYAEKKIWLMPNTLPAPGTDFTVSITPRLAASETFTNTGSLPQDGEGRCIVTLAHANLRPGSVRLEFSEIYDTVSGDVWINGEGQGVNLPPKTHPINPRSLFYEDGSAQFTGLSGSINHTTGDIHFSRHWNKTVRVPVYADTNVNAIWRYVFSAYSVDQSHLFEGRSATLSYYYGDASATVTETHTPALLMIDVTPGLHENVVMGSLSMALGGHRYVDNEGKIYADPDPTTGAGALVGSLDISSGLAGLTVWLPGAANAPALLSVLTRVGVDTVDEVTFRAPASPVASNSVQITATDTAGNTLTATADGAGTIQSSGIEGFFYYSAGLGVVRFGDWVTASAYTAAPWYHAGAVVNGLILKPRPVIASSVRFNCRTINYLPVDSTIIKIDSKRLPRTGRVPIIQKGDWLLIHHTLTTTASSATAGGVIDLGRTGLERVWVRDVTGKKLPGDKFSAVLATGIFTWAAPLSLAGYSAPFTIYNRKMHRSRATRVDLSGRIDLEFSPDWDIPSGANVSSALLIGDLQGRLALMFTQGSWDTNARWVSATPNTTPTALYNQTEYPVLVSNRSTTDSYALIFTDGSHFKVESKGRGELATAISIGANYTLVNSVTGENEFTIYAAGFGTGWVAGNVIRLDIEGAKYPWNLALTCQPGNHTLVVDHLTLEFAGGV